MTKNTTTTPDKSKVLELEGDESEPREATIARAINGPHLASAAVVMAFGKDIVGPVNVTDAVRDLARASKAIHSGDMTKAEAMLLSQATALNALFAALAQRSASNIGQGQYLDAADRYMRLALRAQSQCRATLETLAAIKNPPTVFARQANFANGPQQINNGGTALASQVHARAGETETRPNELLEARHGERLDIGAAGTAGGSHSELAALEPVNRTAHRHRKG